MNKPPLSSESALNYPLGDQLPELGSSIEVAPGVRWLRMKLPFALDHINLWLLRDEIDGKAGWTIVDCGIANDETKAAWGKIFTNFLNQQSLHFILVQTLRMFMPLVGIRR